MRGPGLPRPTRPWVSCALCVHRPVGSPRMRGVPGIRSPGRPRGASLASSSRTIGTLLFLTAPAGSSLRRRESSLECSSGRSAPGASRPVSVTNVVPCVAPGDGVSGPLQRGVDRVFSVSCRLFPVILQVGGEYRYVAQSLAPLLLGPAAARFSPEPAVFFPVSLPGCCAVCPSDSLRVLPGTLFSSPGAIRDWITSRSGLLA